MTALRLRLPPGPPLGRADATIHWLKGPGETIGPNEVVATLGRRVELRAPESVAGQVEKLLAAEGERIINRQPLLRIRVQAPLPRGLEEPRALPFAEELPARIVMEPVDKRTHRALAVVGGIAVAGIALAIVCVPLYLIYGGPTVPAIGGSALSIVAAALAYGQHLLRQGDG